MSLVSDVLLCNGVSTALCSTMRSSRAKDRALGDAPYYRSGADEYGDGVADLLPTHFWCSGVLTLVVQRGRLRGEDAAEVGDA